jgi:carboxyl-terminal processing protease
LCGCNCNGWILFSHAINEAIAATETTAVTKQAIVPSQEQALVSRQLATLVDRQHYLNHAFRCENIGAYSRFLSGQFRSRPFVVFASEVEVISVNMAQTFGAA